MKVLLGKGGPSEAGWHMIEALMHCEKEFQYKLRGITKPMEFTPDHFAVGSIFHAGRARWFASNFSTGPKTWKKIVRACEEEALAQKLPVSFKAGKIALTYLQQYIAHWRLRPKPRPIAAEYLLGPAKLRPSDPLHAFRTAKLDDVGYYPEAANQLCIGESKTTSGSIQDCILQYQLHGQPVLQYMLWKAADQGEKTHGPVAGTILDVTKKGYGGRNCSFRRVFIPFEPRVLEWFADSMVHFLTRKEEIKWNTKVVRRISSCTRMGGRGRVACDYQALCAEGKSASIHYVMQDGSSLLRHKRTEEQWVRPWV